MKGGALKLRLLNPVYGALKNIWPIMIKTQHETTVHLNAVIVQHTGATQVIFRRGRFLARLHQVIQAQ